MKNHVIMRRSGLHALLLSLFLFGACVLEVAGAGSPSFRTVALSGDPAPGTAESFTNVALTSSCTNIHISGYLTCQSPSGTKTHIYGHFTCQGQQKPNCIGPTIQSSNLTGIERSYAKNQYCSIDAGPI